MSDPDQPPLECISRINMNDENKIVEISFDHYMKKLDFLCDNTGISIRGNYICDIETINKFNSVLDYFGFQDGETNTISGNRETVKELISCIMKKFEDGSI